jgi:hypothetical protein
MTGWQRRIPSAKSHRAILAYFGGTIASLSSFFSGLNFPQPFPNEGKPSPNPGELLRDGREGKEASTHPQWETRVDAGFSK